MQNLVNYLDLFLRTNTPFMLLFVTLFLYVIKTNRDREIEDKKVIIHQLNKMEEELQVIIKVWKILLEKELEARK